MTSAMTSAVTNLVEVANLNIRFTGERKVHAVNDLSFALGEGEVLGLLGESGSGKSVTLRALAMLAPLRAIEPSTVISSPSLTMSSVRLTRKLASSLM